MNKEDSFKLAEVFLKAKNEGLDPYEIICRAFDIDRVQAKQWCLGFQYGLNELENKLHESKE